MNKDVIDKSDALRLANKWLTDGVAKIVDSLDWLVFLGEISEREARELIDGNPLIVTMWDARDARGVRK